MILRRHYLKEFGRVFFLLSLGLGVTFSLFELIQLLGSFMPHDPAVRDLATYTALKVPQYLLALLPVASLMSGLYIMGHAARTREVTAYMAAGGRVKGLLVPFVLVGVLISLLGFALSEYVVPAATREAQRVRYAIKGAKAPATLFKSGQLWLRAEDGSIVRVGLYAGDRDVYKEMSVYRVRDGELTEIIEAREAGYSLDDKAWQLRDVKRHLMDTGTVTTLKEDSYDGLGQPSLLKETAQRPTEMGISELYRYVNKLRDAGFKNLRLRVDLYAKLSYPIICLIMLIIGVTIPVRRDISGVIATAMGLLIVLGYWFGYSISLSMGYTGVLPPLMAAWLMPILAGGAGAYLFVKIPE